MLTLLVSVATIIVLGMADPYHLPAVRRLELFNEATILLWAYYMAVFTDFVPNVRARYSMGWHLMALVGFNIFVNIAFLYRHTPRQLGFKFIAWKIKKKRLLMVRKRLAERKKKREAAMKRIKAKF